MSARFGLRRLLISVSITTLLYLVGASVANANIVCQGTPIEAERVFVVLELGGSNLRCTASLSEPNDPRFGIKVELLNDVNLDFQFHKNGISGLPGEMPAKLGKCGFEGGYTMTAIEGSFENAWEADIEQEFSVSIATEETKSSCMARAATLDIRLIWNSAANKVRIISAKADLGN